MTDRDTRQHVRGPEAARRTPGSSSDRGPLAQLLIAWAPLGSILLAYLLAQWLNAPLGRGDTGGTNRLGFGLHVSGPAGLDQTMVGVVPSVWLQRHLVDGSPHWYDAVAALVYVTHFVSLPLVTGVVWFRMRDRFASWVVAVLTFTALGIGTYVVYPAAPPWLAYDQRTIGTVSRISDLGWQYLHLDPVAHVTALGQGASNPVAAMPSLHAGAALLITAFLWPGLRWGARAMLTCYTLLMGWTLVYSGEHYACDVLAGWLTAAVAVAVATTLQRRHAAHP